MHTQLSFILSKDHFDMTIVMNIVGRIFYCIGKACLIDLFIFVTG